MNDRPRRESATMLIPPCGSCGTNVGAVVDVIDAWRVAGSHPEYHRAAQERMRREWPALASALDNLAY